MLHKKLPGQLERGQSIAVEMRGCMAYRQEHRVAGCIARWVARRRVQWKFGQGQLGPVWVQVSEQVQVQV